MKKLPPIPSPSIIIFIVIIGALALYILESTPDPYATLLTSIIGIVAVFIIIFTEGKGLLFYKRS